MAETKFTIDKDRLETISETVFDVPPEKIFKAYTDASLIPEWWGPKEYTTDVETMDLRVGGVWRYVQYDQEGKEYAFNGRYEEIDPNKKMVTSFEFESMPGHISTNSLKLEPAGGKTKMIVTSHFANKEDLEGMVGSGMEKGWRESVDRLEKVLKKIS